MRNITPLEIAQITRQEFDKAGLLAVDLTTGEPYPAVSYDGQSSPFWLWWARAMGQGRCEINAVLDPMHLGCEIYERTETHEGGSIMINVPQVLQSHLDTIARLVPDDLKVERVNVGAFMVTESESLQAFQIYVRVLPVGPIFSKVCAYLAEGTVISLERETVGAYLADDLIIVTCGPDVWVNAAWRAVFPLLAQLDREEWIAPDWQGSRPDDLFLRLTAAKVHAMRPVLVGTRITFPELIAHHIRAALVAILEKLNVW